MRTRRQAKRLIGRRRMRMLTHTIAWDMPIVYPLTCTHLHPSYYAFKRG